jgi:hypothetical protein
VFIGVNGKVGVGTNSPMQKFEVHGVSHFFGQGNYSLGWGNSSVAGRLTYNTSGALIMTPGTNDLTLGTNGGGSDQLVLSSNGNVFVGGNSNVGVGTTSPSQKLDVAGNIAISGVTIHSSDIRLKNNINLIQDSVTKLRKLKGVEYFWNDKERDEHKQIGLIAQDVLKVFPELVYMNEQTGHLSVNYSGLVAPLIEAIKVQDTEIKNLKSDVKLLKTILCQKFSESCIK